MSRLVVGTRASALALWQTGYVIDQLCATRHTLEVEVKTIKTQGDKVQDVALSRVGGKGLFVKEIEEALLSRKIDLAVHSLKDMPTVQPAGLVLAAILERGDPRDALVLYEGEGDLYTLPAGARVGTSSLRRRAQLLAARPDLDVVDLRGNVDTRLRKVREGEYDAAVLAAAGLERLGHGMAISQHLPVEVMMPAVGQGALCVEVRADDVQTREWVGCLDHTPTRQATDAERALLRWLEGGCQVPVGAYGRVIDAELHLRGLVAAVDGDRVVRDAISGPAREAERLGFELAERLLEAGAREILAEVRRAAGG